MCLVLLNTVFSGSAVMPCQFHSIVFSPFVQFSIRRKLHVPCTQGTCQFRSFSPKAELGRKAALLPVLPISASGNTQYGATQASLLLGNGMVSITDLTPIDLHRETMLPVPLNKGLATSIFYSHHINCRWVFAKLLT